MEGKCKVMEGDLSHHDYNTSHHMMTSWDGFAFRITAPLWGESVIDLLQRLMFFMLSFLRSSSRNKWVSMTFMWSHCNDDSWWRHQMETFSGLLAICAGNSPVPGEFHAQRPVTRSFDFFFDLRLNKWLSKQSWGWRFETLSQPFRRHCNVIPHSYNSWWAISSFIITVSPRILTNK